MQGSNRLKEARIKNAAARLGRFRQDVLLLATLGASACGSAAGVILDLPENSPQANAVVEGETTAPPAVEKAPQEVPSAIESILDPDSVLALLPKHQSGQIDWSMAIRDSTIRPRAALPNEATSPTSNFGFDFYFGAFETYFPHSSHTAWLTCGSCHPAIFRQRGLKTSMQEISEGETCGACHGVVAFSLDACERCHTSLEAPAERLTPSLSPEYRIKREDDGEKSFPPSIFPHGVHRIRYTCGACHPVLFNMEPGSNEITMESMRTGENCGTCHNDAIAFGVMACGRCHVSQSSETSSDSE